jgi:hypothetical protein
MIKTFEIGDERVVLSANAATTIYYRAQFNRDFFGDALLLMKVFQGLQDAADDKGNVDVSKLSTDAIAGLDLSVIYRMVWIFAYSHDKTIPPLADWLAQFDSFPLAEATEAMQDLIGQLFDTAKKSTAPTARMS